MKHALSLLLAASATFCLAQSNKISKDLANKSGTLDVIIQFTAVPGATQNKKVTGRGGTVKQAFKNVKGGSYKLPASALGDLASDPEVVYISLDRESRPTLDYATSTAGADIARASGLTGNGVGVAVIDSGVTEVNDLKGRIAYSENFVPLENTTNDLYGHGSHVAGIVAGNAASSSGNNYTRSFFGMAPGAKIVNLRVLSKYGVGLDSSVIAAIDKAITLKSSQSALNIKVINLSLGRPIFESYKTDPLCQAVEAAWNAGIAVVAAAGNLGRFNGFGTEGYGMINSPANDPYVITVGAMKTMSTLSRGDDLIASYSSKGPTAVDHIVKPDVVAPGNRVISLLQPQGLLDTTFSGNTVPISYYQSSANPNTSSSYFKLSGTSMATPVVSGTLALMFGKDSKLTPNTAKARIMKTATKSFPLYSTATDPATGITYTSQYDIFTVGAGYLDAAAALNNTDTVANNKNTMSPVASFDAANNRITVTYLSTSIWTTTSWGTGVVWGDRFLSGTNVVWGEGVVWGDGGVASGTNVVWSDGVVWGDGVIWGDNVVWADRLSTLVNGEN